MIVVISCKTLIKQLCVRVVYVYTYLCVLLSRLHRASSGCFLHSGARALFLSLSVSVSLCALRMRFFAMAKCNHACAQPTTAPTQRVRFLCETMRPYTLKCEWTHIHRHSNIEMRIATRRAGAGFFLWVCVRVFVGTCVCAVVVLCFALLRRRGVYCVCVTVNAVCNYRWALCLCAQYTAWLHHATHAPPIRRLLYNVCIVVNSI